MLSRRRSQLLALSLLMAFLSILLATALLRESDDPDTLRSENLQDEVSETLQLNAFPESETESPGRPIVIENFERSLRKDGKVNWSATGDRAYIYSETGETLIDMGVVDTQTKDGKPVRIEASQARITMKAEGEGSGLQEAQGFGGVRITSEDTIMETDEAKLDTEMDLVSGAKAVTIRSGRMVVEGTGFQFDIEDRILEVGGRVHSEIRAAE